jgi:hypothetical protein
MEVCVTIKDEVQNVAWAGSSPVLTPRGLLDLIGECGNAVEAGRFLVDVATGANRPVLIPGGRERGIPRGSRVHFICPRTWSEDRLRAWIAAHREEIEEELGEVHWVRNAEELARLANQGGRDG